MSILSKPVSYFRSVDDTTRPTTVNLLNLLTTQKHENLITSIRQEPDPIIQKNLKEQLPCYTVAGVFSSRCNTGLLLPSGLAAVDLDSAEDYDPLLLLSELKKIRFIAYAGLSCRGQRLFAIVPFLYPQFYERQYDRLVQSFADIGLPMGDTCHKTISQPRFISFNTAQTCFFNHNAAKYHLLPPVKQVHSFSPQNHSVTCSLSSSFEPFNWCETQIQKNHSFVEGQRHNFILALARYCNIKGIPKSETLAGCLNTYQSETFPAKEITSIVNHIYLRHQNSFNTLPFQKAIK